MTNTNIRTLKIFEFNRALFYVSEIIKIERGISKLQQEIRMINAECNEWEYEETENGQEQEDIKQIIKNLVLKEQEINDEIKVLESYLTKLKDLVSKILEFVIEDEDLELTKEEIQPSFLEEYVYLLSEPLLEDGCIIIEQLFENKAELAILIFENYGREKEELLVDIVNTDCQDYLPNCFVDYFPLS